MEKIEKIASEINLEKPSDENEVYQGLELLEEKYFQGGTSVKYWM